MWELIIQYLAVIAVALNLLMVYVALVYSHPHFGQYKWALAVYSTLGACSSFVLFLSIPVCPLPSNLIPRSGRGRRPVLGGHPLLRWTGEFVPGPGPLPPLFPPLARLCRRPFSVEICRPVQVVFLSLIRAPLRREVSDQRADNLRHQRIFMVQAVLGGEDQAQLKVQGMSRQSPLLPAGTVSIMWIYARKRDGTQSGRAGGASQPARRVRAPGIYHLPSQRKSLVDHPYPLSRPLLAVSGYCTISSF